jgi:hypothetical protein
LPREAEPRLRERQDGKLVDTGLRKNAMLNLWDRGTSTSIPRRKVDLPRGDSAMGVPAVAMVIVAQSKLLCLNTIAKLVQKSP